MNVIKTFSIELANVKDLSIIKDFLNSLGLVNSNLRIQLDKYINTYSKYLVIDVWDTPYYPLTYCYIEDISFISNIKLSESQVKDFLGLNEIFNLTFEEYSKRFSYEE